MLYATFTPTHNYTWGADDLLIKMKLVLLSALFGTINPLIHRVSLQNIPQKNCLCMLNNIFSLYEKDYSQNLVHWYQPYFSI